MPLEAFAILRMKTQRNNMSNQSISLKRLLVLGMFVASAWSGCAITMSDFEDWTFDAEIHVTGENFQRCGVGMHRSRFFGSYLYIVEFPSEWNRIDLIEVPVFKGVDLGVFDVCISKYEDDFASSVTFWRSFLNCGKGVTVFMLPVEDMESVLYVTYGSRGSMELQVQIPVSEFNCSPCLVDQTLRALVFCSFPLVPFGAGLQIAQHIYDCAHFVKKRMLGAERHRLKGPECR